MVKKTDKSDQISMIDEFDWKHGHGGKRAGSGRPKAEFKTKVVRIPVALESEVKVLIDRYKQGLESA
jgi:hypothetical protein